jgi:predicted RNase H-like HicB family nuclease
MNKVSLKYTIVRDGKFFVVKEIGSNLVSQGKSKKEAIKNFLEAHELLNDGK